MDMKQRWIAGACVAALVALVASCASSRSKHTLTTNEQPQAHLQCAAVTTSPDSMATIGPEGGHIVLLRGDGIRFAPQALNAPPRTVRVRQLPAPHRGIEVSVTPAAPQYAQTVDVFVSLAGCTSQELGNRNWHIFRKPVNGPVEGPGDRLQTTREGDRLRAVTDRNSWFIIAD
jgi:hypothetical protein